MTTAVRTSLLLLCLFASSPLIARGVTLPDAQRVALDNGVVLLLNEKHDVPLIGIHLTLRGGAVTDLEGKEGLASLFASLIQKGAGERSAAEFAEAIDSVGGSLHASASTESIDISGDFLSRDADLAVELLGDMLQRPSLARDELDKLRERSINMIRAAKDSDPGQLMPIYANAFLFGDHPYARPVDGSETSLANISLKDVQEFYEEQVGSDRLIISMSGDFDTDAMRARLEETFADWRPAAAEFPEIPAESRQPGRRVLLIDKPGATQTYFWIGNVGVSRYYASRADLDLANTVFGGRFTSMLNTALRVESGLTYGARSRLRRFAQPGSVAISSYTRTDATIEAIDMALGILGQLHDTGVGEEMIDSARNYVLGQFPTRLETASQLAEQFAVLEQYAHDRSYIDDYAMQMSAVDSTSIAAVIDEVYPQPDDLVFVLLGDAEAIREQIRKYGPVTELSITEPRFTAETVD